MENQNSVLKNATEKYPELLDVFSECSLSNLIKSRYSQDMIRAKLGPTFFQGSPLCDPSPAT